MQYFSDNTLYYFFSTVAQLLAATMAILSVVLQFRINEIRKFLIGDGEATYNRILAAESGYVLQDKYKNRLRDSLGREDIEGIQSVLLILKDNEVSDGKTLENRPRGLQYLYNRYSKMKDEMNEIKTLMTKVIVISLISILLSLIALGLIDHFKCYNSFSLTAVGTIFVLTGWSLFMTYRGIKIGMK